MGVLGSDVGVCTSRGCFWFLDSPGLVDEVGVWVFVVAAGVFGSQTALDKGAGPGGCGGCGGGGGGSGGGGGGGAGAGADAGAGGSGGAGAGARVCAG